MEWLSAENLVAVGTAVLGIAASGVMVWYERRVPRRKRIGHKDDRSASVVRCELDSTGEVLDKVARVPGAAGYSELAVAAGHKGVRTVPLDGVAPSVKADRYPYRGVEYAYTHRAPRPGSLAAAFLAYLDEATSQDVIREYGHLPCERREELCG